MNIAGEDLNILAVLVSNEIAKNKTSDEIALLANLANLVSGALSVLSEIKSENENANRQKSNNYLKT